MGLTRRGADLLYGSTPLVGTLAFFKSADLLGAGRRPEASFLFDPPPPPSLASTHIGCNPLEVEMAPQIDAVCIRLATCDSKAGV